MTEDTRTASQINYDKGIYELEKILHSLQILEKDQVSELLSLIHRDGRLDTKAIRESWPGLYGFTSLEEMIECVAKTYKLYLTWPKDAKKSTKGWGVLTAAERRKQEGSSISESTLFTIASDLNFKNNFELIQKFDPEMQKFIAFSICMESIPRDQNTIMTIMVKSGVRIKRVLSDHENVKDFFLYLKKCLREIGREDDFEITFPDSRIVEMMKENVKDDELKILFRDYAWGPMKPTILSLLVMYYGQAALIEAVYHLKTGFVPVHSNTLMRVLENWDEMKNYPPAWIIQICSEN